MLPIYQVMIYTLESVMKVSVEKLPSSEAVLEVDLSWEELEKASDKAYRRLVQKVDVHGFRRGKAPRSILERTLGKDYIYQEALDDLITDTYRNAVKEYELTPLAQPELDAPVFERGQPYHFSLKVPILSPVTLGDYHSLHFDREEAQVTSEEVEKELETLRNQRTTWHVVEHPAAIGDRATVDLKLTSGDQNISDLKDNPFELTDDRHGLFSGMDEQVVGMSAGESKSFTTTIPADYSNEKLAGKEAQYEITVHKVEEKEVPELEDAFAAEVSNNQFTTLEDLRKAISDDLLESKKRRIREDLREKVIDAVIEQAQVVVHPILVQDEAEEMLHQLSHMLEQQHLSMDQYLLLMRKSREEYLKEISPDAEKRVKRQLVLDEVAQQEEINVDSAEIDALLQAYAQAGQNLAGSDAQRQALASALRREKTITRLVELTTDPDPDEEAERAEDEEVSVANAEAAALSGEEDVVHVEAAEAGDIPEPALPTPGTEEPTAEEASNQTLTDTSIES
jgi:trigger factor